MKDIYKIGKCIFCGLVKALKNDVCAECEKNNLVNIPDMFKNLFESKDWRK